MTYKYAKPRSDEEKKEIYDKWRNLINMSQKALDTWADNDHRLLASINRSKAKEEGGIQSGYDSFHRIKRRKGKKFEDWSAQDFDNASQENGFNSRMLGGKPGDPIGGSGMSKWEISLKNWGHDPSLKSSPQHAKWKAWKMKHTKKSSIQRVAYKHLQKSAGVKLPKIRLKLKQFFMGVIAKRTVHILKDEQVDFVKTKPFVARINGFIKGLRKYGGKGFVNASLTLIEEQDFPYKVEGLDLDQDLTVQATALYGETISRGMSQAGASNGISDEGRVEISIFNLDSLAYKMLEDIDEVIEDVSQMVDHESIHYVQRILQRHKDSSAGLPKKKERTPEWGQKNMGQGNDGLSTFQSYSGLSKHHVLDDIEFWPFVQDLTTNSIRTIKRTEVSAEKIIELLTSKKALKEMSLFPGSHRARKTDLRFLDKNIQYLSIMAEDAPRKYKRSIKELKKELQKKGLLQ